MAFTAVGIARNLHDYGLKRAEYETARKNTMGSLIQNRALAAINYEEEARLIAYLDDLEASRVQAAGKTTLDLGNKAVKLCAGPVAGVASNIITSVMKKQGDGSEDLMADVTSSVMEVGIQQVQKEVAKELCNTTTEVIADYAADWLGIGAATAAFAMAPLAFGLAGLAGIAACVLSPSVRETCSDYVANTAKGTEALFSEVMDDGKSKEIIDSYRLWHHKWTKYQRREAIYEEAAAELKSLIDELNQQKADLKSTKLQIRARKKDCFKGFVYWVNDKPSFYQFLTRLFSAISTKFKKEVASQNDLFLEKLSLKDSIDFQNELIANTADDVDQLAAKLQLKKAIVDNLEKEYSNLLE